MSASQRKCTQVLAKRDRKYTQVFNLRLLATPFGQGLRILDIQCKYVHVAKLHYGVQCTSQKKLSEEIIIF